MYYEHCATKTERIRQIHPLCRHNFLTSKNFNMYKCQPSFFSIKNSLSAVTLQTICSSVVLFALFIQKTIMNDSTAPLSYECDRLGSNDNFFFQQNIINIFTARFIKNSPLLWFMLTRIAKLQWVDEIPPH